MLQARALVNELDLRLIDQRPETLERGLGTS